MQAINQQVVAQQLLPWAQGETGSGTQRIPRANFEDLSWADQGAVVKRAQYSSPHMVGDKWFCWWAAQDRQHRANMEHRWKCGSGIEVRTCSKGFHAKSCALQLFLSGKKVVPLTPMTSSLLAASVKPPTVRPQFSWNRSEYPGPSTLTTSWPCWWEAQGKMTHDLSVLEIHDFYACRWFITGLIMTWVERRMREDRKGKRSEARTLRNHPHI